MLAGLCLVASEVSESVILFHIWIEMEF